MSAFTIKVYYCGNREGSHKWQSHLESVDDKECSWGDNEYYGTGETIDIALAETGRQLQALCEKRRADYLATHPTHLAPADNPLPTDDVKDGISL